MKNCGTASEKALSKLMICCWKRMWLTLLDFKIGDQQLALDMAKRFLDLLPTRKTLFPHTVEILTYLTNKGYRLHLITNGFEQVQHMKLKYAGIDSYFVEVITSEGSSYIKPNKEIFEYAFQKTKALPAESIMIGDNVEVDIQGAINAGHRPDICKPFEHCTFHTAYIHRLFVKRTGEYILEVNKKSGSANWGPTFYRKIVTFLDRCNYSYTAFYHFI